ncbi:hypothetical protein ES703_112904 [subsurface metagenome]
MPKNDSTRKELPAVLRTFIKIVQLIIFAIIQLVLLPLTITGYIFLVVKVLLYSKKHGISATTTNPLSSRCILHIFGLRKDEAGTKMITSLPHMSGAGLWLMMGPSFIAYRICEYTPKLARLPEPEKASLASFVNCRTEFFDKIMEKNIKVFELDKENTQSCKIEALKKAGINYEWITFIPIDFNQESWVDKLIENGFDTSKKTFFLLEELISLPGRRKC